MNIVPKEITIQNLFEGYKDNEEEGVVAYKGKLDIRPPYQREFVYNVKQRDAVIDTVIKGHPLNSIYSFSFAGHSFGSPSVVCLSSRCYGGCVTALRRHF